MIYALVGSDQSLACLVSLFSICIACFSLPVCFSQDFSARSRLISVICLRPRWLSSLQVTVQGTLGSLWLLAAISPSDRAWIYIKGAPDKAAAPIMGSGFFSATQTGGGGRGSAGRTTREMMLHLEQGLLCPPAWQSPADPTAAVSSPKNRAGPGKEESEIEVGLALLL